MKERIAALKERYAHARTASEREAIDREMSALAEKDNEAFSAAMVALAHETSERAAALVVREQLEPMLKMVSLAYVAKTYFGKSRQWLYQRINGYMVNGRPARFTPKEIETLNAALRDMSAVLASIRVS